MAPGDRLRWLVPEVVQTSAMDCGPASLKAVLDGFGIPVSYGRLREACQTQVDGSSIDTLEEVAVELGLDAEQIMIPADHLLLDESEALPALVVTRLPSGVTHFLVVWRRLGPWVQVMDPGTGRRWQQWQSLIEDLYLHEHVVPAAGWREWAGTEEFTRPLDVRLERLGIVRDHARELIAYASVSPAWQPLAALDSSARLVQSLVDSRAVRKGRVAEALVRRYAERAHGGPDGSVEEVPAAYWSVRPVEADESGEEQLALRGAVLVRFKGRRADTEVEAALPPELRAALTEPTPRPGLELLRVLREDGVIAPLAILLGSVVAAGAVFLEALLFRAMLDAGSFLGLSDQRALALGAFALFLALVLALRFPISAILLRTSRGLETRLRIRILGKIPRLADRYFHSRLSSDMAERAHSLYQLRALPELGGELVQALCLIVATAAGIIWLDPAATPVVLTVAFLNLSVPLFAQRFLTEKDLRVRTHFGALMRFYLDGLLGLMAARCHAAERALRNEHESLVVDWVRSGLGLLRAAVGVSGVVSFTSSALAIWLLVDYLDRVGESAMVLLLVYWALNLPALGNQVAKIASLYPGLRNTTLRIIEPLTAPDETVAADAAVPPAPAASNAVAVKMQGVSVRAGGHVILEDVNLQIEPGSHIAVVGPSGAGKSSLVGLLLGWHQPTEGTITVDDETLEGGVLQRLRRQTAWVDPEVRLWNRSFVDNLSYGCSNEAAPPMSTVIRETDLYGVVEGLPEGLQTPLGEGGCVVSGGEGQRVRLARALIRPGVRLAILDEPFRGLDRKQRRRLLDSARRRWAGATLVFITHDVGETVDFERVLVVERGHIVEDGNPVKLWGNPKSGYARLLTAEQELWRKLWTPASWRVVRVDEGVVRETDGDTAWPT